MLFFFLGAGRFPFIDFPPALPDVVPGVGLIYTPFSPPRHASYFSSGRPNPHRASKLCPYVPPWVVSSLSFCFKYLMVRPPPPSVGVCVLLCSNHLNHGSSLSYPLGRPITPYWDAFYFSCILGVGYFYYLLDFHNKGGPPLFSFFLGGLAQAWLQPSRRRNVSLFPQKTTPNLPSPPPPRCPPGFQDPGLAPRRPAPSCPLLLGGGVTPPTFMQHTDAVFLVIKSVCRGSGVLKHR